MMSNNATGVDLSKILGGQIKILGEQKAIIGGHVPGLPPTPMNNALVT